MKRLVQLSLITCSIATIVSCAGMGSSDNNNIPQPPNNPNIGQGQIMLPQIGESKDAISVKSAAAQNESQPGKFKTITDVKGPGGAVTQVNVDNPDGGMPDYYLTPKDNEVNSSSHTLNPNPMSTPQWGVVSW